MTTENDYLGGRLSLVLPSELSTIQRKFYTQLQNSEISWANKSGFIAETNEKELIGPFNSMLRSPEIASAMIEFSGALTKNSSLSEKIRQIVILTTGAFWNADYEFYAHTAVAKKAGLDDSIINSIRAGQSHEKMTEEETTAFVFTNTLISSHKISPELYHQAIGNWGEKGIFDLIALAGLYMTISSLLNTFEVPVPTQS